METFIYKFKENIKRVFSIMINSEVISKYILKDYISEIKVINDYREKEKNTESKSNPNNISKNIIKSNNSSQNLTLTNNLPSKSNNSGHMITTVNNSFLYLNSSFKSLSLDKKEDLIIECKWKKKFILLLKIKKIYNKQKYYKTINIECLEMNHFENPFSIEISLYWDSTEFQTIVLNKITYKDKIIDEILNKELNDNDKRKINDRMKNYLLNDLTNIEHCETSLILGNMKDISLYISDIKKLITLSIETKNMRLEVYDSPLISYEKNCNIYDKKTNELCQEFILTGYYIERNQKCQIKWENNVKNKLYCIYRLSLIYLEDNISLMIFRKVWQTHIPSDLLNEAENRTKKLFEDVRNYFVKKSGLYEYENLFYKISKKLKLKIGIKNVSYDDYFKFDLDNHIHYNASLKNGKQKDDKEQGNEYDSLFQNSSFINNNNNSFNNGVNFFTDTIQNISEIENINSLFLGNEDTIN
jgi:hypothetical protein